MDQKKQNPKSKLPDKCKDCGLRELCEALGGATVEVTIIVVEEPDKGQKKH